MMVMVFVVVRVTLKSSPLNEATVQACPADGIVVENDLTKI